MMRNGWLAMAALGFGLASTAAPAAVTESQFPPRSTGDLLALCTAATDDPMMTAAVNFCHGFAEGAVALELETARASRRGKLFCLPDPAPSRTQALAAFVAWANADQSRLAEPPVDGLFHFLRDSYPCGKPARR